MTPSMVLRGMHRTPSNRPVKGIVLNYLADDDLSIINFGGKVTLDLLREMEPACVRACSKASQVELYFHKDCEATSAMIGLIMRLKSHLGKRGKPLTVRVLSPRVLTLIQAIQLEKVLDLTTEAPDR